MHKLRVDVTDCEVVIAEMAAKMNETGVNKLSLTDVTKMCIERCYGLMFPDRPRVVTGRKRFVRFPF